MDRRSLDGTNNFESGLASFATAITVLEDGEPILGVVYVPMLDDLYVATGGEGVRYNGRPVGVDDGDDGDGDDGGRDADLEPSTATVVSVIGHDVKREPDHEAVSEAINRALEDRCKRRLESWSPTVHWGCSSAADWTGSSVTGRIGRNNCSASCSPRNADSRRTAARTGSSPPEPIRCSTRSGQSSPRRSTTRRGSLSAG